MILPAMKTVRVTVLFLFAFTTSVLAQGDIRIPPSILPTNTKEHILYKNDIEVVLPCIATGSPPPTYEWTRDGDVLDVNARNIHVTPGSKVGTIRIQPITSLDEGYYQCRATNIYGSSVSKVFFLQRATFGRYPPTSIQNYTKKEGLPLKLKCFEIKSVPTPTYNWALVQTTTDENPVGLVPNRRVITDENGNLYFSYVTKEDARIEEGPPGQFHSLLYKCNVFNSHLDFSTGGSYSRIIVTDGNLAPRSPTLQYYTQSPYIAVKGGKLRIQCIFAGIPEVGVTWSPRPGGRSNTEDYGTVLLIDNVQFTDEGIYTCTGRNSAGEISESINVDVQSSPEFEARPTNLNATEMDTVSLECRAMIDTEPPAKIEWFINGEAIDPQNPGPRTELTDGGQRLTIANLCKDCSAGTTDLKVIQCNASNVHGYVFADGYLNVLLKTVIFTAPVDQNIDDNTAFATFNCEASSDASTPVTISWERDGKPLAFYADERLIVNSTTDSLTVKLDGLDVAERKKYEGLYTCIATNTYSTEDATVKLTIEDSGVLPVIAEAGKMWWIFLIIALILLLLILCLCCCICVQRNRGEAYPVDEKERQQGNDPEKECADSGFHDYHRPEDGPVKGSRASLTSTIKLDSDDEGSLAEYGDIDTGKFNEDGSFIGQYMTDKKKKQSNV